MFQDASANGLNPFFLAVFIAFFFGVAVGAFILTSQNFALRRRWGKKTLMEHSIQVVLDDTATPIIAKTQASAKSHDILSTKLPPWPVTSEQTIEFNAAVRKAFQHVDETIRQVDSLVNTRITEVYAVAAAAEAARTGEHGSNTRKTEIRE
jgi:hypothetical protein